MGIIAFIILGFVAGLIARAVMPGRQGMSLIMTTVLGIAGSFIGGFLVALVTNTRVMDFNATGLIGSVVGALALLAIVGAVSSRRSLA